jgi:hypothetical protein
LALGYALKMDWEIAKSGRQCAACERAFAEGEDLFSGLYDENTAFVRRDYCGPCWQSVTPDKLYSFWRTRVPPRDEPPKRFVDDDVLLNFFYRLEGESDELKVNFRYVLALLLVRKKLLKLTTVRRDPDSKEWLILHDRQEGRDHEVLNPQLTAEQVISVTDECGRLLNMQL